METAVLLGADRPSSPRFTEAQGRIGAGLRGRPRYPEQTVLRFDGPPAASQTRRQVVPSLLELRSSATICNLQRVPHRSLEDAQRAAFIGTVEALVGNSFKKRSLTSRRVITRYGQRTRRNMEIARAIPAGEGICPTGTPKISKPRWLRPRVIICLAASLRYTTCFRRFSSSGASPRAASNSASCLISNGLGLSEWQ